MIMYKFLFEEEDGTIRSKHGNIVWKPGEWHEVEGEVKLCRNGLHASPEPLDALAFVPGNVVALVEGDGDRDEGSDSVAFRRMRIVKYYRWANHDSVALALYAANIMLPLFESKYPNDHRPRRAIEIAESWLKRVPRLGNQAFLFASDAYRATNTAANDAFITGHCTVRDVDAYLACKAAWIATHAAMAASKAAAGRIDIIRYAMEVSGALRNINNNNNPDVPLLRKQVNAWMKKYIEMLKEVNDGKNVTKETKK